VSTTVGEVGVHNGALDGRTEPARQAGFIGHDGLSHAKHHHDYFYLLR